VLIVRKKFLKKKLPGSGFFKFYSENFLKKLTGQGFFFREIRPGKIFRKINFNHVNKPQKMDGCRPHTGL